MFGAFKKVGIELADEMRAARLAIRTKQHNRDWAPLPRLETLVHGYLGSDSMFVELLLWKLFNKSYRLTLASVNVWITTGKHAHQQVTSKL